MPNFPPHFRIDTPGLAHPYAYWVHDPEFKEWRVAVLLNVEGSEWPVVLAASDPVWEAIGMAITRLPDPMWGALNGQGKAEDQG